MKRIQVGNIVLMEDRLVDERLPVILDLNRINRRFRGFWQNWGLK